MYVCFRSFFIHGQRKGSYVEIEFWANGDGIRLKSIKKSLKFENYFIHCMKYLCILIKQEICIKCNTFITFFHEFPT